MILEEIEQSLNVTFNTFVCRAASINKPMYSMKQERGYQAYKFNFATCMPRCRKLTRISRCWLRALVLVAVVVVATGCSRQNYSTPEEQSQNLPAVGSVEDYLAQERNDYPYMYSAYGYCDPFMIDPFCVTPSWYFVPVYYFHGEEHRHNHPPISAGADRPPAAELHASIAPAAADAPRESPHFGTFGGAMRGIGAGHMGGGRR
jgi:hypothetical protein